MHDIIDKKDYKYEFYNIEDDCPTLIIYKKSKSTFENDAIVEVLTNRNAFTRYYKEKYMDSDIVYFELNNWMPGRNYPNEEPFITWCGDDLNLYFDDEDWVKENKLCVVTELIDMSINWCITAPKEWVEKNCPKLLSDESTSVTFITKGEKGTIEKVTIYPYSDFLRFPDEDGDVYGDWGTKFKEYSEENIGITWREED